MIFIALSTNTTLINKLYEIRLNNNKSNKFMNNNIFLDK